MAEIIRKSVAIAPYSSTPAAAAGAITNHPFGAKLVEVYRHNLDRMEGEWNRGLELSFASQLFAASC
jgi:hypothetical protein